MSISTKVVCGFCLGIVSLSLASAVQAAEIKDKGSPVSDATVKLTGKTKFQALGSGIECLAHVTVTGGGSKGEVTTAELTTSSCLGFGTPYKNCNVASAVATTPWPGSVISTGFTSGSGVIDATLGSVSGKTCFTKKNIISW